MGLAVGAVAIFPCAARLCSSDPAPLSELAPGPLVKLASLATGDDNLLSAVAEAALAAAAATAGEGAAAVATAAAADTAAAAISAPATPQMRDTQDNPEPRLIKSHCPN